MNKKGFTLVELLVVFVIIALIGGIGLVSYKTFLDNGESNYYKSLENNIILAANDYFLDNRDMLPVVESENEVELSELVEKKYLENIKGSNGQTCSGTAVVYKENGKYVYEACLNCDGYHSKGKYCPDPNGGNSGTNMQKSITITGRTQSGGTYNPNLNYENVSQVSEKVTIIFSMNNVTVDKYEIINTGTSKKEICEPSEGNTCEWLVDKSGTYSVTAYDDKGNALISNQRFNVRIVNAELEFTVEGLNHKLTQTECNGNKHATVKFAIKKNKDRLNDEYKKVEYGLKKYTYNGNSDGEILINSKQIHSLSDTLSLASGHYELIVKITNFADKETIGHFPFNISYDVEIEYDDDHSKAKHEVVKDYPYNYLKALPTVKDAYGVEGLDIKWTRNGEKIDGTTIVTDDCSYKIIGEMAIPVDVPTNLPSYCNSLTYSGSEQTLTKTPPTDVTFTSNKGTNAGTYTVKAHINAPLYIWKDGTFADKEFTCSIQKLKCSTPTGISISSNGTISWTASSNCSSAQHQISFNNSTWENASSGVDKKSTLVASTGNKTVYVKAIAPSDNYITSEIGSGTSTVYSVTLNKGTEKDHFTVSGDGNYLKGASATLTASFNNPYYFVNWKNGTTQVSTSSSYSITNISANMTLTANVGNGCADGNYTESCSNSCPSICYGSTGTGTKTCNRTSNVITGYDCGTTQNYITCNGNTDCRSWHSQEDYYGTCYCGSCSGYMWCLKKCQYMYNSSTWACTSSLSTWPSWDGQTDGQWCWCKY